LQIQPCIPDGWPGFEITYRYGSSTYHVVVENAAVSGCARSLTLDGRAVGTDAIDLANDGQWHEVRIVTGA
jgi:cellobiose phosphorylase